VVSRLTDLVSRTDSRRVRAGPRREHERVSTEIASSDPPSQTSRRGGWTSTILIVTPCSGASPPAGVVVATFGGSYGPVWPVAFALALVAAFAVLSIKRVR
jgi:hypothetical protein